MRLTARRARSLFPSSRHGNTVLPLYLSAPSDRPVRVLTVGAHPDDIEIGAGGSLLSLAENYPGLQVHYVVLTGTLERHGEARHAAASFLPGADVALDLHSLPEGKLPAAWAKVKDVLEGVARRWPPDLILAPSWEDSHQDHRTIGEIVPTVFRDSLYLAYEVPKWDGDLGHPSVYVPLPRQIANRKAELLNKCFPSQHGRDWWDDEVFLGMARLRGMECRSRYAEAFRCAKSVVLPLSPVAGGT